VVGKDFADALGAAKTGSTGQPGAR
jgi:hypothetical protein